MKMTLPGNGIFVVKGEMSILMTAMRRSARWSSHSYQEDNSDPLTKNFQDLKDLLNKIDDLRLVEPNIFLTPFLEVVRSDETTGPVTSLALSAINKFLSYGLIDPTGGNVAQTVHNIADAVTHAKFVGTDQSSDGVVLMRILQVLRTLTLSPEGVMLTNESLCEIMLSCFRICFESRLNELLRRTAEHYLKDMVLLVFMRLPQFSEDLRNISGKQLKMKHGSIDQPQRQKRRSRSFKLKKDDDQLEPKDAEKAESDRTAIATTPVASAGNIVDMQGAISQANDVTSHSLPENNSPRETTEILDASQSKIESGDTEGCEITKTDNADDLVVDNETNKNVSMESEVKNDDESLKSLENSIDSKHADSPDKKIQKEDYVNQMGIRFTPQTHQDEVVLIPYGLASVRELFRFLISLCNPLDKQNTEMMIHLGLTLLTVAFEVGADSIGRYSTLLALVKDDLCRNLFSLLSTERLSVFAADLQVAFLMFESLRTHLKFQLENYLTKLMDIISNDSSKMSYEQKEMALDNILQLWRIPGFVTELYLNYDCDMYCTNLYEDLTKLLAKNSFSAAGIYHIHLLSLDALLTVVEVIEQHCSNKNFDYNHPRGRNSDNIPSKKELAARKNIKKWLPQGTEYFNQKPKKGIQFLQEHNVLKSELDPQEIAIFLRENPALDKKMIGEYISNRSNLNILDAYVKTFDFTDLRIDEALRAYLEAFRLPGEAPTISLLLEHFAEHWHKSNGEPFADVDAAFTLAYAIIMLNVDQHNQNAKKQTVPMSLSAFKKNLKGVNGNGDFDEAMLDEIYTTIKNDEIVMPAEQTGLVRENYLWKVLLRKGKSKDGIFYHLNNATFDSELFQLIYGPIIASLSFIFERTEDVAIYKRVMQGFEKCALIAAHFDLTKNLDMIILTLCKFTIFYNQQKQNTIIIQFGANQKAQLAFKTVISLIIMHGNCIREGWRNLFDLILSLYTHSLMPKIFVESEDFIESSGRVLLVFKDVENAQKQDTGILSSLYSYMVSESLSKEPSPEEQHLIDSAKKCINDCNLEQLIEMSKFLHEDALLHMVQTLVDLSRGPDVQKSLGYNYNENVTVFFLELLVKVVIQNRDRVITIWQIVRDHIYTIVMNASLFDYQFLLERSVIGLLRIAIRLMRNEEMSPIVLQSLRMLLLLKSSTLCRISRQISYGLYELLKTSAQNIHTNNDWTIIFTLLECVGAGAQPPKPIADEGGGNVLESGTKSDGETQANSDEEGTNATERGYTSDSELTKSPSKSSINRSQSPTSPVGSPNTGGWILVGNEGEIQPVVGRTVPPTQYGISLERNLGPHDPSSLIKCCESLSFLVRDVAHITPYNFDICVHCIRTFVEASLHGCKRNKKGRTNRRNTRRDNARLRRSPVGSSPDEEDSDEENLPSGYHQISIQLLDLMHTLHTRTAQIFKWWAEEGGDISQTFSLWTQGWCPLLQGIARLCCDVRRQIRMSAITYLQRALLVHDLQTLTGPEWEACFHRVLFPLLGYLLQPIDSSPVAMEETRMRAATVLSKVFLHHLTPLLSLPTFYNLWFIILDFMDKYMHADKSDLLYEAIPESLKNMLLVMDSAKVFDGPDGQKGQLWHMTWDRIGKFLPNLKEELFREMNQHKSLVEAKEGGTDSQQNTTTLTPVNQPLQHNIENATRSSIILQPPSTNQQVSSHLFAHLGQMVSTPIGISESYPSITVPTINNEVSGTLSPSTSSFSNATSNSGFMQPTLQPGMPYMPNYFNSTSNPPQLVCTVPSTKNTTEQIDQPVSLYSEYVENPYNQVDTEEITVQVTNEVVVKQNLDNVNDLNSNHNENTTNNNFFQTAQYFNSTAGNDFIPAGSEILFGVEGASQQQQTIHIPESKSTDV